MGVTIRDVMTDPALFGKHFAADSWTAWRALLAGFYGLSLDEAETEHWTALTGRTAPLRASEELWLAIGRRGGKSQSAALLAVYAAAFKDYRDTLAPGEIATVRVMAADRQQARVVMRYIGGLIRSNPMVNQLVTRQTPESIELSNRVNIEVGTASFRTARGYSFAAVIADEIAFWRSEDSANPDSEIIAAVRPGLATLGGPLIALSSPYAKRGELWDNYRRYYGTDSPVLVAQAPSRTMNPKLPQRIIDDAMERDESAARAEYLAEFRDDLETFLSRPVIEAAKRTAPLELEPGGRRYMAFVDPAGGGQDEFTIAIAHIEGGKQRYEPGLVFNHKGVFKSGNDPGPPADPGPPRVVVDLVRGRKGKPAEIVSEFAGLLRAYGITKVVGDRYAGSWPADEFSRHNVTYEFAAKPKSDLYVDALPAFNSGRCEIPADDQLITQLSTLERRTSRTGKDSIDHRPGGHDDRANAVAGVIAHAARKAKSGVKTKPIRGLI